MRASLQYSTHQDKCLQPAYKRELERLTDLGIITEVQNEFTPWVNSVVVTPKADGSTCHTSIHGIWIKLWNIMHTKQGQQVTWYPRSAAQHTSAFLMPEVVIAKSLLTKTAVGSASSALLGENSGRISFHLGWPAVKTSSKKMDTVFGQLDGLTGIADDTFVYGKGKNDHDQHILNTLDTARENNMKFNPDKFQFKVNELFFFGLTWTAQGLKPDEKKVKCIVDMQSPQNLRELQSLMGMINYLDRFSPVIAQISDALCQLMKEEVTFVWQPGHQKAFQELKQVITEAPVLAYYDANKENLCHSTLMWSNQTQAWKA